MEEPTLAQDLAMIAGWLANSNVPNASLMQGQQVLAAWNRIAEKVQNPPASGPFLVDESPATNGEKVEVLDG